MIAEYMIRIISLLLAMSLLLGCGTAVTDSFIPENIKYVEVHFTPGFGQQNQPLRQDLKTTVTDKKLINELIKRINNLGVRTGIGGCTADTGQSLIMIFKSDDNKTFTFTENLACYSANINNGITLNDNRNDGIVSFVRQNIITDIPSIVPTTAPEGAKLFSSLAEAKSKYPSLIAPNSLPFGLNVEKVFLETKSNQLLSSPPPKISANYPKVSLIYTSQDKQTRLLLTETPDNVAGLPD
jgi:hypothetical protein